MNKIDKALAKFTGNDTLDLLMAMAQMCTAEGHALRLELPGGGLLIASFDETKNIELRELVQAQDGCTMPQDHAEQLVILARAWMGMSPEERRSWNEELEEEDDED